MKTEKRPLSPEYVALQATCAERNDANKVACDMDWSRVGVKPAERVTMDTEMYNDDARRAQARGRV